MNCATALSGWYGTTPLHSTACVVDADNIARVAGCSNMTDYNLVQICNILSFRLLGLSLSPLLFLGSDHRPFGLRIVTNCNEGFACSVTILLGTGDAFHVVRGLPRTCQ